MLIKLSTLKRINFYSFIKFIILLIFNPLKSYIILKTTAKTEKIARTKFPKTHGSNTYGNAFKHILWNFLIAKNLSKINAENAINFTQKFTTLYEEAFVNEEKFTAMDLHNNKLGLQLYLEFKQMKVVDNQINIINFIEKNLDKSIYYN